ncbi:MAG: NAD-dependent epimerase/dehydratase family protein [Elusimicrobia bacterium]|nr:NAD-dependent epimerase/dehydratase family protein [Elusimicrobiota bacterium]
MKFKKIVVTGGFGFLGKNVVSVLKKEEHEYEVFPCSRKTGVDIRDLEKTTSYLKKINPDIVIHCAAHVGGIAYNELYPVEVFEDNTIIGMNIVKASVSAGIRHFLDVMPNCTYPGALNEYEESLWWDGPMHESVLTYGLPRKMLWGSCFAYGKKHDFKALHLILPNMYGPDDHFEPIRSHALGALIAKIVDAKMKNLPSVEIWGTGKPVREWLYVKDTADCITKVLINWDKFEHNELVNIGIKAGISVKDMAELIKEITGWKGKFIYLTDKPDGAMKKILRADKMKKKLNWEPPTSLRDGIAETIKDYISKHYKK